jgi:hypothetical protein
MQRGATTKNAFVARAAELIAFTEVAHETAPAARTVCCTHTAPTGAPRG